MNGTKPVEVICQFNTDGSIIPIKIRVENEEQEIQVYKIKAYREPERQLKNEEGKLGGIYKVTGVLEFMCKIDVFDVRKIVTLKYFIRSGEWKIVY